MNCTRVRDLLPLYADGDLEGRDREAVARHLEGCAACRTRLALDQELGAALAALSSPADAAGVSPDLRRKVMHQVERERRWRPLWRTAGVVANVTAAVAALALVGLLAVSVGKSLGAITEQPGDVRTAASSGSAAPEPCRAADLRAEVSWQGAGGVLAGVVALTNQGATPCTLEGRPQVRVIDARGQPLSVTNLDMPDKLPHPAVTVQPGQQATVRLVWSNWCGPQLEGPATPVIVEVRLPGNQGGVTATIGQAAGGTPRCDVPDSPSTVSVGHFATIDEAHVERGTDRLVPIAVWWQGSEPGDRLCLTTPANGGILAGPCDAPEADLRPLSEVQRAEELAYLSKRFKPFKAQTPAGFIVFDGRGEEVAPPAWQRAIAEWGRLVHQELKYGRSGASWGLALAWEQQDEKDTGRCSHLQVEVYGVAFASSSRCGGGDVQDLGWSWLTTEELERLSGWRDRLAPFERTAPGRLLFGGSGTQPASEAEVKAIADWAEARFRRQARPVTTPTLPPASQYISREQAIAAALQGTGNVEVGEVRLIENYRLDIPTQERRELAVWQVGLVSTLDKRPAGTIIVDAVTGKVLMVSSPPSGQ